MSHHEFPLMYYITGIFPKHRTPSRIEYLEFVELEVNDVDEYEAPVGAVISSEHGTESLRYFDGKWYIADRCADIENDNAGHIKTQGGIGVSKSMYDYKTTSINVLNMSKSSVIDTIHYNQYSHYRIKEVNNRNIKLPNDNDFRIIHENERQSKLLDLAGAIEKKVISVDGVLYTEVPEPVFVFEFSNEMYNYSSKPEGPIVKLRVVFGTPEFDEKEKILVYSIDQREEVDRLIDHLSMIEKIDVDVITSADYIFGHASEIRRENVELINEAKHWIRYKTESMRDWDRSHIDTYLDFRDAWQASVANGHNEETLDKVSETLRDYGKHTNIGPYTRLVIDRWNEKPINIEFDFNEVEENSPSL